MKEIQVGGHQPRTKDNIKYALIDDEDYERVSKYNWGLNNSSNPHTTYAYSSTGSTKDQRKKTHLHRFIMGLGDYKDDKRIINHIDGDGLNNQKCNLEICDTLYNSQSFRKHHCNIGCVYIDTSGKRKKRWRAIIIINKVKYHNRFLTEQEGRDFINDLLLKL